MPTRRALTPHRLLTHHFLRQFLANDLIAPDADRSQLLAMVSAAILSLTLFVSAVMSFHYVGPLMTPGLAAAFSLTDKFFYLAFGMIVLALVAASQWDALAVDARDAAILEPLPIRAGTIRRAKLTAIAVLGAAAAVAVNAFPSLVFPALLVYNLRELSLIALLTLMTLHAAFTIFASGFGYLSVIALREALLAVLGVRWFTRVSPWIQGALIVTLGGALLLLPAGANRIAQRGDEGWRPLSPPMWFLGAYEAAAGGIIADLPRRPMTARMAANDRTASALYSERRRGFLGLARRARIAGGLVILITVTAYWWNARRLPSLAPVSPPAFRRHWGGVRRVCNALLVRHAAARAGFYFAIAAMWRSNTHRLTLASAAAVGFAMAVVAASNATLQPGGGASARVLAMQPLLYGALLVGFRHAIRVPAELRANWGFQLAWRGHERAFVTGVKSAAIVALALPAIVVLLPLFVVLLGPLRALVHAGLGVAGAIVFLEALMLNYEKVPFTCTYLPSENMKALAPIYLLAFVVGASSFARMQYNVLHGSRSAMVLLTLLAAFALLRLLSIRRARLPFVHFDEAPATFQRLGLDR
jgi:hypothetical protein